MIGKERKIKWQRVKNPAPIILQPRDVEIVTRVYEFGFMSREQIQRLEFNGTIRANMRLRKLFDRGYLARKFLPAMLGSTTPVYFLGPEGISLISERKGIDASIIQKRQKALEQRKDLFFKHDLLVNDVRIVFYQALANPDGLRLVRWLPPIDCLEKYSRFNPQLGKEEEIAFRPDGYFRYFYNKPFDCYLELDRSTMNSFRFQAKAKVYLEYGDSGSYKQKYGLESFRVLVFTKSKERLANLKAVTEKINTEMFWFTTWKDLEPEKVFGLIWQKPGKEGNFSLLES